MERTEELLIYSVLLYNGTPPHDKQYKIELTGGISDGYYVYTAIGYWRKALAKKWNYQIKYMGSSLSKAAEVVSELQYRKTQQRGYKVLGVIGEMIHG